MTVMKSDNITWEYDEVKKVQRMFLPVVNNNTAIVLAELKYGEDVGDWEYTLYFKNNDILDYDWMFCNKDTKIEELKAMVEKRYLELITEEYDIISNILSMLEIKHNMKN